VSALVASPAARGLFHKAIGESGAFFSQTLALTPLEASERAGSEFASALGGTAGADSLEKLRARPASEILAAALRGNPFRFVPNVDGRFLPETVYAIYEARREARVPLLAGWNADESRGGVVLGPNKPTTASVTELVRKRFGAEGDAALKFYPAGSDAEALESAASLASDVFIGYSTWKWIEMHAATSGSPVYRYSFDRKIPVAPNTRINGVVATSADIGARHAGEIEYVFGTLDSVPGVTWQPEDRELSREMMTYWTNFARSSDPGGPGLPTWPRYHATTGRQVLHLDTAIRAAPDPRQSRYEFLDRYFAATAGK
jgi:para-nitrobenzyl esterase